MGKFIPDTVIDAMLVLAEGDTIHVLSAQPTAFSQVSGLELASGTAGSYSKANGDTSGRKNTQAGASGLSIDNSGTATHVAITVGTDLKLVTTCTSQALTSGGTVDINPFDHEIGDAE
jgi:hypothetical protein